MTEKTHFFQIVFTQCFTYYLACEQAPRWGIGRNEKLASGAIRASYGGKKERKGACGHSLNAAIL